MNRHRTDANERVMRPYLHGVASSLPDPEHGLDRLLQAVASTPQRRRRWLPPEPGWSRQPVFSAVRFLVAAAIVVLFGGTLLAGVVTQESEEALPVGATASPAVSPSPGHSPVVTDVIDVGGRPGTPLAHVGPSGCPTKRAAR